jgi:hypothetical protein
MYRAVGTRGIIKIVTGMHSDLTELLAHPPRCLPLRGLAAESEVVGSYTGATLKIASASTQPSSRDLTCGGRPGLLLIKINCGMAYSLLGRLMQACRSSTKEQVRALSNCLVAFSR